MCYNMYRLSFLPYRDSKEKDNERIKKMPVKSKSKRKTNRSGKKQDRDKLFGQRVRRIRSSLNLKQEELAKDLGITATSLSDIENSKTYPCYDFFHRLCVNHGVNLNFLLSGEGEIFMPLTGESKKDAEGICPPGFEHLGEDARVFLEIFLKSRYVQYHTMGYFRCLYNENEPVIKKDIKKTIEEQGKKIKK